MLSISLPPLGTSDHNTIHLTPAYRSKMQIEQILKKDVKVWSCDSVEKLQGGFDCTDWDMFLDSCDNIHDATDVISDYITFCEDMILPKKTVQSYPNSKPWVSNPLKKRVGERQEHLSQLYCG